MTSIPDSSPPRRTIRSFARRARGRTPRQQQKYDRLWQHFGCEISPSPCDPQTLFDQSGPVTLEIGFGRGEVLLQEASEHPQHNVLGIEVHPPSLMCVMREAQRLELRNIRVAQGDASLLLPRFETASLQQIRILFPDPWPKKRHRKRRLLQDDFLRECARCVAPQGVLHVATDWEEYADQIQQTLEQLPQWQIEADCPQRTETHFEKRGQRLEHSIREWAARRHPDP